MSAAMPKDIVIDVNVMCLYDTSSHNTYTKLFYWLREEGTLTVGPNLIKEYRRSGKKLIMILINELQRDDRYNLVDNSRINSFTDDRHFKYTCNFKDEEHARVVFLSYRKKLVTLDKRFKADVNNFKKIGGVKPCACSVPTPAFYE